MANINHKWERFLAVGCSHGSLVNRRVVRDVVDFKRDWDPQRTIHLGDYTDETAFRTGARGTKDEYVSIADDIDLAFTVLDELGITDLINGNHDQRLWELIDHPNEIINRAAKSVVDDISRFVTSRGINWVKEYDINDPRAMIVLPGDLKFLHGYMYNRFAIEEHAEHFGNCVIAHLHTPGDKSGRRFDHPICWCVGTLMDITKARYASRRRNTSAWGHALVYGECSDVGFKAWTHRIPLYEYQAA